MAAFSARDHECMAHALRLAERGMTTTTPNPRVGCVVAAGGQIVGEGWHERAGAAHAEINALNEAGGRARGGTAYVTLEPCNHHGRTPPCADALIAAGIRRVVAAMPDPNPLVSGQGFDTLRNAGIEVSVGLMAEPARELNIGFVSRMLSGRPWVRLKVAASLDGRTALADGASQWITGPDARRDGHRWRARSCAVLTGIGTLKDDNPRLTVRDVETTRQPLRVVVDSRLETPPRARILEGGNVLVVGAVSDERRIAELRARDAEVVLVPGPGGKVALPALLEVLASRGINEVLCEAGLKLNGSLLREGCVDELLIYLAPSLLGDSARGMFSLPGLESLAERRIVQIRDVRQIGDDLRLIARLRRPS